MKLKSTLVAVTVGMIMALAIPGTANASPSVNLGMAANDQSNLRPAQQDELDRLEAHAAALEAADTKVSGVRTFDFGKALASGVPTDLASGWASGIASTGGRVINAGDRVFETATVLGCRGEWRVWIDGWGTHVRLDSCITPKVVTALQGVGNAAFIAAAIGGMSGIGAIPGGAIALAGAMLNYSAWSIDQCSKNGTGVELAYAGFVCWAQ
jgi:hypothetical protein